MPPNHNLLDFRLERAAIQAEFDQTLLSVSSDCSAVSQRLMSHVGLRHGQDSLMWMDQFSSLVLLYPTYQASCLGGLSGSLIRRANVAHLCFLIYAFVDDRRRDRQVELDETESRFVDDLMSIGCAILQKFPFRGSKLSVETRIVAETRKQLFDDHSDTFDFVFDDRERALSLIAVDRAMLGYFSTAVLASVVASESPVFQHLVDSYFLLVLGMQWIDDAEDWKEDLTLGDSNLLLESMKTRKLIAIGPRPLSTIMRDVSRAFVETDALDYAILKADTCFARALTIQADLDCNQLTMQLEIIRNRLPLARRRMKRRAAEEFSGSSSMDILNSLRLRNMQVSNRADSN